MIRETSTLLRRVRIRDFLVAGCTTYGALWVVLDSLSRFFESPKPGGWAGYGAFLAGAAIGGLYRAWPRKRVEFTIPGSGSTFEIKFGDIFDGGAVVVIPVNDFFDGELGDHVSETSLHGQFIKGVLGGQSQSFSHLTSEALTGVEPKEEGVARLSGRCNRYALGTVARVDVAGQRYLLAVLSHTDPLSLKASASLHDLWTCLTGVWNGVREHASGRPVSIPLIGSGLSGVGLPPRHLLNFIVTSFFYHNKEKTVADRVTLVLPSHLAQALDLKSTKRRWT